MKKQTVQYASITKNGIVTKVGKSVILQPKTDFRGGSIKWHKDRQKETCK